MPDQINIPNPFGVVIGTSPVKLLNINSSRKFLQVQNQSKVGAVVTIKFDTTFNSAQNAQQLVTFDQAADAGTWHLTYGTDTIDLAFDVDAATLQSALEAIGSIGNGNVTVTGTMAAGFTITFIGTLAETPVAALAVNSGTLTNSTGQTSCTMVLSFSKPPTAGTYELGSPAANVGLSWDATPLDMAAALNSLPDINGGVSNVTQDPISKAFTIYFASPPTENTDVPLLFVDNNNLESNVDVADGEQNLWAEPQPLQGTVQLMVANGERTAPLAFDADGAAVQAALELVPSIGAGNVLVTGSAWATGFNLKFQGALAGTEVGPVYFIDSTFHADILQEPQKRVVDIELRTQVVTAGHGIDAVVADMAYAQRGQGPTTVSSSVTVVTVGNPQPVEGMTINAGDSYTREVAVPVGAMWALANDGATPVQVWEG